MLVVRKGGGGGVVVRAKKRKEARRRNGLLIDPNGCVRLSIDGRHAIQSSSVLGRSSPHWHRKSRRLNWFAPLLARLSALYHFRSIPSPYFVLSDVRILSEAITQSTIYWVSPAIPNPNAHGGLSNSAHRPSTAYQCLLILAYLDHSDINSR